MLFQAAKAHTFLRRAVVVVRLEERTMAWGWNARRSELAAIESEESARLFPADRACWTRVEPLAEMDPAWVCAFDPGPRAVAGAIVVDAAGAEELPGEPLAVKLAEMAAVGGPLLGRLAWEAAGAERLRALEERIATLERILDGIPDPVLALDADSVVRYSNARAEQILFSLPDESPGRRRAVEVNNLLFSSFLVQEVVAEPETRELNLVNPQDGSDLLFEVLTVRLPSAVRDARSTTVSILRDITDLKRAVGELETQIQRSRLVEHDARRERDRLNVVLENVADPILVTDETSNLVLLNREGERLFVVGGGAAKPARRRLVHANDTRFSTLMNDFLLQPELRRQEKVELVDPDSGRSFPAEISSAKILNARGEATAIVSVVHDLTQVVENERLATELRHLNEELEGRVERATEQLAEHNRQLIWQRRELEKASRMKSQFLASMSHELRTPINVVLGYTSLMQEQLFGTLTPKQIGVMERIHTTSKHLLELINDILDLSRIEAGKMPIHVEEVDTGALLSELAGQVRPLLEKKGLTLTVEADDLPDLMTDRTKLMQVLLNLMSNAIKFTQQGGVALRARAADEGWIRITVEDTGIGIKPEHLNTIFEDFRQVDQSPSREYGGTGLGLSITKKLLSLLGGTIDVDSEVGVGTAFSIEVPRLAQTGTVEEQVHRATFEADSAVVSTTGTGSAPDERAHAGDGDSHG